MIIEKMADYKKKQVPTGYLLQTVDKPFSEIVKYLSNRWVANKHVCKTAI